MAKDPLISAHSVNQAVSILLETLERKDLWKRRAELDPGSSATLDRALFFAKQTDLNLAELSASELSINLLDGISSGLNHANNEIVQFIADGNIVHISNASSNLDAAIASSSQAFFRRQSKNSKIYVESIASVEKAARSSIEEIRNRASEVETAISTSETRIAEQIRANEEARDRLNAAIIDAQNATNNAKQKLERLENRLNASQDEGMRHLSLKIDEVVERKADQAQLVIDELEKLEIKAKSIVQIIGNIGAIIYLT